MAAYRRVDGFKSPAGRLPVHWVQLRAQHLVTSMGELYLYFLYDNNDVPEQCVMPTHCLLRTIAPRGATSRPVVIYKNGST